MDQIIKSNNNDIIIWEAKPSYYDYFHRITLDFNSNTFRLDDGCEQTIKYIYEGNFDIKDDYIIFNYQHSINPYLPSKNSKSIKSINIAKNIKFTLENKTDSHFDGYIKYQSKWVLTIDSSPFNLNNSCHSDYPLVFYTNFSVVSCDLRYERVIRNEKYFKKEFMALMNETRQDILDPNSEETRQINATHKYEHWYIIYLNKEKREIIIAGIWTSDPIFIIKNNGSIKYYVPKSKEDFTYVQTHNDDLIRKYSPNNSHPIYHPFNYLV